MRPCPRNIDKPLMIFGLEPEDIALLGICFGFLEFFFSAELSMVMTGAGGFVLKQIKKGKPKGYIIHGLYRFGIPYDGLIPYPKKPRRYSRMPGESTKRKISFIELDDNDAKKKILGILG